MVCKKCGEFLAKGNRTCVACGAWNSPSSLGDDPKVSTYEEFLDGKASEYGKTLKSLASGKTFILGCLLITVGVVGSVFVDFTWLNILGLAFAAFHVVGLWMLVGESFVSESSCKMTLAALSMFKISAILSLVLICIIFGLTGIAVLFSIHMGIAVLIMLAIIGGIGYVLVKFYFLALLNVLSGIRERISTNKIAPLTGLDSFLVMSYIMIGINIVAGFGDGMLATDSSWGAAFSIANGIGMLLCLRVLKKFDVH